VPSNQSSITFSSIPSTYRHLQLRYYLAGTGVATDTLIRFNGDSGSNYSWHDLYGTGSGTANSRGGTGTAMYYQPDGVGSAAWNVGITDIYDYAQTTKTKTIRTFVGFDSNGSGVISSVSGNWNNTNAITSIVVSITSNNIAPNSTIALYGIKG